MDKISGLNNIIQIIRQQSENKTHRSKKTEKASTSKTNSGNTNISNLNLDQLEQHLSERINSINKTEPNYEDKINELFIKTVLVWQFGDEILQDRKFNEMVKSIQKDLSFPR
ncbi:MAG: hypothetical protein OEZ58_19365 [Gammaproteobacteria bacterium]|nr:hypothetical protein [Gammaproteobacteria bacterium]